MTQGDEIGRKYLLCRAEGKSSKESCEVVRAEFEKPDLSDATIRSYAAKIRQLDPDYRKREKKIRWVPLKTSRVTFHLIPELLDALYDESFERKMTPNELLNHILFQRFTKER
jgi:hypothetical protein